MLGRYGQVLAVVPWSLVLPEGDYQLGDYIVAAARQRLALAPTRCLLAGYPRRNWDGTPNQMLMCVLPALQERDIDARVLEKIPFQFILCQ